MTSAIRSMATLLPIEEADHAQRLELWNKRMEKFAEQTKKLAAFMKISIVDLSEEGKQFKDYEYDLTTIEEDRGTLTHGNTEYCEMLQGKYGADAATRRQLLCRKYDLEVAPEMQFTQIARIQAYFSRLPGKRYFLQIYHVFRRGPQMFLFHEQLAPASLAHRLWNQDSTPHRVKSWAAQLAEAVEVMNVAGVSHRFLRLENVLVGQSGVSGGNLRIKIACFDVACRFWEDSDGDEGGRLVLQPLGLPQSIPRTRWDHLPPECFVDQYDATMVDVWSIGVIICTLLTWSHPFDVREPVNMLQKWKWSSERTRIRDDDIRPLLDDIFLDSEHRITAYDLSRDKRLSGNSKTVSKTREWLPYYRIDKNPIEPTRKIVEMRPVDPPLFNANCKMLLQTVGYKFIKDEVAMQKLEGKNFVIHRNQSFTSEFVNTINVPASTSKNELQIDRNTEHYLKAEMAGGRKNCLVKIFVLRQLASRYRNMLATESTRIIRYFSENNISSHIHVAEEIFINETQKLYIFYQPLSGCQTLRRIIERSFLSAKILASIMLQVCNTIDVMISYGVSHRYIRPEYVFLTSANSVIITHLDMACLVYNSNRGPPHVALRNRGLQDEKEYQWDHLPPECFIDRYDSILLDVWSAGVLLVFCLTRRNPFTIPHTIEAATQAWTTFKANDSNNVALTPYLMLLNRIFVPTRNRIRSDEMIRILSSISSAVKSFDCGGGAVGSTTSNSSTRHFDTKQKSSKISSTATNTTNSTTKKSQKTSVTTKNENNNC